MTTEPWRLFWAKTNREKITGLPDDWTHPLWAHLIDVGSAAQVLWDNFLPATLKQKMADALGMDLTEAGRFLSIWIGLHDLGKGIPNFQGIETNGKKAAPKAVEQLAKTGLHILPDANRLHHGHASIAIAHRWLEQKKFADQTILHALAAFVGIHHGKLCQKSVWESVAKAQRPEAALGDNHWKQAQHDLTEAVFMAWGSKLPPISQFPTLNPLETPWPDWLMAFAGWATLADWLGSMQDCYDKLVQADESLTGYLSRSFKGAVKAYERAGLNQQAHLRQLSFLEHFGKKARPLQDIAARLSLHPTEPNLVIVEAPTGEGKTEAAFLLAARNGGGLYVAMPSQSTSDGLHPRLQKFIQGNAEEGLKAAHVGETAALRLVHGNDILHKHTLQLLMIAANTISDISGDDEDSQETDKSDDNDRLISWFMPKKRALLVPYGVGTVDQLFLGVLYAKHFFLRLFALCGKTVIFDEVHAYDAYMNTVFSQLLRWLRALDIQVVVLSATLPGETRRRMIEAWGGSVRSDPNLPETEIPYPVIWHTAARQTVQETFKPDKTRKQILSFRWCGADTESITQIVRNVLGNGATVMVVCNTVQRAQEVFAALDNNDVGVPMADRVLLHARMPQAERQKREEAARTRFGPNRTPEQPGLLVGTQVVEQSLDLDVDVLISDLAPVDLLLQRAGRLHRHKIPRPKGFVRPKLYIACPTPDKGNLPEVSDLSGGGNIYEVALLWKTWAVLKAVTGWALPQGKGARPGYRTLIEAVYGDVTTVPDGLEETARQEYKKALPKWTARDKSLEAKAAERLIPKPDDIDGLFTPNKPTLADEDDALSKDLPQHLLAATRNPDSINAEVLLLYATATGWSLEPGSSDILRRHGQPPLAKETLRSLFGAAVRIGNPAIVRSLWEQKDKEWVALQQNHRILKRFHLIEMQNTSAIVGQYRLKLHSRLGLQYEKLPPDSP